MQTVDPTPAQIALLRRLGCHELIVSRLDAADRLDEMLGGASPDRGRGRSTSQEVDQPRCTPVKCETQAPGRNRHRLGSLEDNRDVRLHCA